MGLFVAGATIDVEADGLLELFVSFEFVSFVGGFAAVTVSEMEFVLELVDVVVLVGFRLTKLASDDF